VIEPLYQILLQGVIVAIFFGLLIPFLTWALGDFQNGFIYDKKGEVRISLAMFGGIAIMALG
jgi:hypothetical protein